MNNKSVCVITATYPLASGYGGIFVRDHCEMLQKKGYRVSVLYAVGKSNPFILRRSALANVRSFEENGIKIYVHTSFRFATTYTVPLLKKSIIRSCERLFSAYVKDNGTPDLLIAHILYPIGIGAAYLSRKYNIPLLVVEHLSLFVGDKRPWLNSSLKEVVEQSRQCICVSEKLAEGVYKRIGSNRKLKVIPNPIDQRFVYSKPPHADKYVFFSAGNLIPTKNHEALISAFAKAFQENKNVVLRIAGDGPLNRKLQDLIKRCKMENQIQLLGSLSREQLHMEYINCNAFVLFSKHETFGLVYREAMSVGRPVVSTLNGGMQKDWEDSFGILVRTFEDDDYVSALKEMYVNVKNYNGEYIAKKMKELYSFDSVGNQYVKLIDNMI